MATTTMHFGPEWMRKQPTPALRSSLTESTTAVLGLNSTPPPPPTSSHSVSVACGVIHSENWDGGHPLRYSKEEMIRIYQDGVNVALGPEVERWDGIVREIATDPVGAKEMTDVEKRLFSGSLNSEVRRRQSTSDYLAPLSTTGLDRPKLSRDASSATSPIRERFGSLLGARRRDGGDQPTLGPPRKHSISGLQQPLPSPRDAAPPPPTPRGRSGTGAGFDGVLGSGETWNMRRRGSETRPRIGGLATRDSGGVGWQVDGISEMKLIDGAEGMQESDRGDKRAILGKAPMSESPPQREQQDYGALQRTEVGHAQNRNQLIDENGLDVQLATVHQTEVSTTAQNQVPNTPGRTDLASIDWSYLDTQGIMQGPFRADVMQSWHDQGYFTPDLLMKRTQFDTDWMSVGELTRRAAGPKIFLSPIMVPTPPGPPGLTRHLDNTNGPLLRQRDPSPFGAPHQPVPIRSLRTSTLDSYINGNSQSASPSSSAGPASNIFGNSEPSINAIGVNRRSYIDAPINGLGRSPYSNSTATYGLNDVHRENVPGHHLQSSATNLSPYVRSSSDQFNSGPGSYQPELSFSTSTALVQSPFLPATPPVKLHQNHTNITQPTSPSVPHLPAHNYTPSASPWGTPDLTLKRAGVFDPTYQSPRLTNALAQPQQPSPWERSVGIPWSVAPSEPSTNSWPTGGGTSSLTVSNLEQHNQQQLLPEPTQPALPEAVSATAELNLHPPEVPQQDVPAAQLSTDVTPATRDENLEPSVTKPRKKSVPPTKLSVSQPQSQQQQPSTPQVTSVSVHSPTVKTVWSKDDDGKPSGVSIGFREIQAAEAKQSEARKATLDRERAVGASRNISTPTEDPTVPTTTSWGLPTSQIQTSRKEPTSTGSPAPAVPVWTNVVKPPAAKTMKEIQEEERRKKLEQQQAQEKEAVNATARRSQAEAASKPTTVTPNPAWTTVGANGKTSVNSQHVRPTVVTSPPTPSMTTKPPANGASPSPRSPAPAKVVTPAVKNEEVTANPSLDFLKWLTDSLKGLNQSVNLEEIMSMLLSFPLDPDPNTLEIISDLIYANSTTLDGRRFAAEFASKRKADANVKLKGNASANIPGKTQSIADVVKTQPKPAQSEWGFKVVNKKKKGGRS